MNCIKTDRWAEINNVNGTAFDAAEFRTKEKSKAYPSYRNSVDGLFSNEDTKQTAGSVTVSFPPIRDLVKLRNKYFDQILEDQIQSSFRQVVILGAGLDTRAGGRYYSQRNGCHGYSEHSY